MFTEKQEVNKFGEKYAETAGRAQHENGSERFRKNQTCKKCQKIEK